jgi:hypothetical protein
MDCKTGARGLPQMKNIIIARSIGGYKNTELSEWEISPDSLAKELSTPAIGDKDGPYFLRCAGTYRDNAHTAETAHILPLDGDKRIIENGELVDGATNPDDVYSVLAKLGVSFVLYSSFSNGATRAELAAKTKPGKPEIDTGGAYGRDFYKYRVIIFCTYTREQLPALLDHLFKELHQAGVMLADVKEQHTWSQPWYFPRVPDSARSELFTFKSHTGNQELDVDGIYQQWYDAQQVKKAEQDALRAASAHRASVLMGQGKTALDACNESFTIQQLAVSYGFVKSGKKYISPHSESGHAQFLINGKKWTSFHGSDAEVALGNAGKNGERFGDAFDLFCFFEHSNDRRAALIAAGEMFKTADGNTLNKQQQIDYRVAQEQEGSIDIDGLFNQSRDNSHQQESATEDDMGHNSEADQDDDKQPKAPKFRRVSIADVLTNPPDPQRYIWGDRVPFDELTLLAAHGGTGKTMFALQMAIHTAVGREFLELPTERVKTLFFSAEDSTETIRRRVGSICTAEDIDPAKVSENLIILDATDAACLFREANAGGVHFGAVSENYSELKKIIDDELIKFAIIDNASDVYGADPVNRQYVTQFIRALVRLLRGDALSAPSQCGTVLLLAHVNRVTAKAGRNQQDTEGYADSAAWHNAARSRLFLNSIDDTGGLLLQHLKNNFGLKQPPLDLRFRNDGSSLYVPNACQSDSSAGIKAEEQRKAVRTLLALILEFYNRGEFISPYARSPTTNSHFMLKDEPAYPFRRDKSGKTECTTMIRECERNNLLVKETYRNVQRKECERLALTDKAVELLDWQSIVRDELDS